MTRSLNLAGVYSQRKLSHGLSWIVEVVKMTLVMLLITAGLSLALWTVLGINPLREMMR